MSLNIVFINPNSRDEVDKYLPRILAEAVLNKVTGEVTDTDVSKDQGYGIKHSA